MEFYYLDKGELKFHQVNEEGPKQELVLGAQWNRVLPPLDQSPASKLANLLDGVLLKEPNQLEICDPVEGLLDLLLWERTYTDQQGRLDDINMIMLERFCTILKVDYETSLKYIESDDLGKMVQDLMNRVDKSKWPTSHTDQVEYKYRRVQDIVVLLVQNLFIAEFSVPS